METFALRLKAASRWVKHVLPVLATATVLLPATAPPARADYCIQLNGGPFSGDIGYFRFKGTRPTTAKSITEVSGRAAGLSPAFGSAIVSKDGKSLEIGVTFFIDAEQGQFDIWFNPPSANKGTGYGDYGAYGLGHAVTVKTVRCGTEP